MSTSPEQPVDKEQLSDFTVTLWRGIPGPNIGEGEDIFRGVSPEERDKRGFFTENYSYAQSGMRPIEKGKGRLLTRENFEIPERSFLDEYFNRFDRELREDNAMQHAFQGFQGLPVFLNKSEAVSWLGSRTFQYPPLLGRLDIPFSLIDPDNLNRMALLSKNYADPGSSTLLGKPELQDFISGKKKIGGELSLIDSRGETIDESVFRKYEKLYTVADFQQNQKLEKDPAFVEIIEKREE